MTLFDCFKNFSSRNFIAIRGFSDGGVRNQSDWENGGYAACGWVLEAAFGFHASTGLLWVPLIHGHAYLGRGFTSFEAELAGVDGLVQTLLFVFSVPGRCGDASVWFHTHLIN